MFDRVFICPLCGEADDFHVFTPRYQPDEFGVRFCIQCSSCAKVVRAAVMDWDFCHRFLRRTFNVIRTDSGTYYPSRWRQLPCYAALGKSQKEALRKMVLDCFDVGQDEFYRTSPTPKVGVTPDLRALTGFILETTVDTEPRAVLTRRDYLSWCVSKQWYQCFG